MATLQSCHPNHQEVSLGSLTSGSTVNHHSCGYHIFLDSKISQHFRKAVVFFFHGLLWILGFPRSPFWFAAAEHLRLAEELRSEQFDPKGRELFAHLQIFSTFSPRPSKWCTRQGQYWETNGEYLRLDSSHVKVKISGCPTSPYLGDPDPGGNRASFLEQVARDLVSS